MEVSESPETTTIDIEGDIWRDNIQRSCPVLYFHFFWGLFLIFLGWTAFASRWIKRIKPYHGNMGQLWIYGMIIQIYTSTYVSYNGFRWFIFMFGLISYGSLIIGHSLIRKYQKNRYKKKSDKFIKATELQSIGNEADEFSDGTPSPSQDIHNEPSYILNQLALKRIHGFFMLISLIMLTGAGAAFTIRWSSTEECRTIYCDHDAPGPLPICWV